MADNLTPLLRWSKFADTERTLAQYGSARPNNAPVRGYLIQAIDVLDHPGKFNPADVAKAGRILQSYWNKARREEDKP